MSIRVEQMNMAANSNSEKERREEKEREAGFLQEVKRNYSGEISQTRVRTEPLSH